MDITKIDKNFVIESKIDDGNIEWLSIDDERIKLYGAYATSPVVRMPVEIADNVNEGVSGLNYHTAGVRLHLRTDSKRIAINVKWNSQCQMPHMAFSGSSGFDLYRITDGEYRFAGAYIPQVHSPNGFEGINYTGGKMCDYLINFPLYNSVSEIYIGVDKNSNFETPVKYKNDGLPVVYYGSSITQGGCASRPGNSYQSHLSRKLNLDYINLGFSGSAKGEPLICEYMSDIKMSAFVSDYDHNAPTAEHLENTHYNLYKTIRSKNPDIPYIMISRPSCGEGGADTIKRREIIKNTYNKALAEGDKNVYFVDGAEFYNCDLGDSMSVDGSHPTDLGFYRFYQVLLPLFEKLFG